MLHDQIGLLLGPIWSAPVFSNNMPIIESTPFKQFLLKNSDPPEGSEGIKEAWNSQHGAIHATISGSHPANKNAFCNSIHPIIIPKATAIGTANKILLVASITPFTNNFGSDAFFGALGSIAATQPRYPC